MASPASSAHSARVPGPIPSMRNASSPRGAWHRLIGRGRTNGEIAAELFVSEGTVKTHVNHVFTKLRLRDRAAAVVFAFDHGLVERSG